MLKKIILAILVLQGFLLADFKNIKSSELEALIKKNVVVIDIRTPAEWKETGVVPTSKKIMFFDEQGNYNIQKWMSAFTKVVTNKNQPFVLVCRSGSRTKVVGNFLANELGYTKVKDLGKGIMYDWKNIGKKVVFDQKPPMQIN